jgi:hypothetical protein
MKNKWKILSLILLMITFSANIFAQNENDAVRLALPGVLSNARALGMGNAYITNGDDYSAMFFNPAGLALSNYSQLTGSFYHRIYENNSTFFGENDTYKNNSTQFGQLGYLYKAPATRGSLVYGFGYQQDKDFTSSLSFEGYNPNDNSMIKYLTDKNDDIPFLLGLSYPLVDADNNYIKDTTHIKGDLTQSGNILESGGINRYNFGIAVEAAKGVFIGGSVNYLSGTYKNEREYYEDDWDNFYVDPTDINDPNTRDFQTFYLNDKIDWDLYAWEFRLGFIIDWMHFIRLGGSAKLPTTFHIKENYLIKGYSQFDGDYFIDLLPSESMVRYEIKTPLEFSLGASIDLYLLTINAQATFIDYTQMEFSGELNQSAIDENNRVIHDNFRTVLNYNIGAEMKIPFTQIFARAGIMYYTSPYKDDPKEFNRVFLNAGAGIIAGNAFKFDVAYSYGFWNTYTDNYGYDESRIYQSINSHTFMLTTTILF